MSQGRPIKPRMIKSEPEIRQFSPRGRRGRPGYADLKVEELEAIRMIDFMGMKQTEASGRMQVSQQTFSRVLRSARRSLAKALINGDIIRIHGGDFKIHSKRLQRRNSSDSIQESSIGIHSEIIKDTPQDKKTPAE